MADSTSMFICYILELLRWNGDTESLKLYVCPCFILVDALPLGIDFIPLVYPIGLVMSARNRLLSSLNLSKNT